MVEAIGVDLETVVVLGPEYVGDDNRFKVLANVNGQEVELPAYGISDGKLGLTFDEETGGIAYLFAWYAL